MSADLRLPQTKLTTGEQNGTTDFFDHQDFEASDFASCFCCVQTPPDVKICNLMVAKFLLSKNLKGEKRKASEKAQASASVKKKVRNRLVLLRFFF